MDCPVCRHPMELTRENYEQWHPDEPGGSEEKGDKGEVRVFDEFTCADCQIGVHPDKGTPAK